METTQQETVPAPPSTSPEQANSVTRLIPRIVIVIFAYAGLAFAIRYALAIGVPTVPWTFLSALLAVALAVLTAIDLDSYRLPDWLTLPLLALGLTLPFLADGAEFGWRAISAIGAFAVMGAIAYGYERLRGRAGLGLGDAKLFAAAGSWLGAENLPIMLLIACLLALAMAALTALRYGALDPSARIAFGPFLALGFWVCWAMTT